jgi:hypothetical protein
MEIERYTDIYTESMSKIFICVCTYIYIHKCYVYVPMDLSVSKRVHTSLTNFNFALVHLFARSLTNRLCHNRIECKFDMNSST